MEFADITHLSILFDCFVLCLTEEIHSKVFRITSKKW